MTETDPAPESGEGAEHAGQVGARRQPVGTSTDHESINVPQTRPGAASNALAGEYARTTREEFVPEPPVPEDRVELPGTPTTAETADNDESEADHVRRDISETRKELGDTVEALVNKADVKGRANEVAAKAGENLETAKDVAMTKAAEMADKVREVTPDQVKDAADKVAVEAKKRPRLALVAAGVAALFVLRKLMKRNPK